jgi:hypothetical protein
MIINFKYYYRQAIVRHKTNLQEMVKAVWAIYKHKVEICLLEQYEKWFLLKFRLQQIMNLTMNGAIQYTADIGKHYSKVTINNCLFLYL